MFTKSIWNSFASSTNFPALIEDIKVDVAIIGGGITGITTALLLKEMGLKIAVLEAKEVGKGTTGHSTGNLYVMTDQLFSPLKDKYDKLVLQKVVASRKDAFDLISNYIKQHNLDCDYKLQSMFVYEDEHTNKIGKEWEVAVDAGIPLLELPRNSQFPFEFKRGVELPQQASLNPLRYVQELANVVQGGNCTIYENTRVSKIEENEKEVILTTPASRVIANYAIHATHTPKGVEVEYHTVLGPYREYGVAVKLHSATYPQGIFWEYKDHKKYSMRTYTRDGENFLMCIGSPHKVGQAEDNLQHIQELLKFIETKFSIKEVTHQWGGQHYKPADLLPYIGKKSDDSRQFIATGFATDGLIYGTLSAMLICDAITGTRNSYTALYLASRHQPLKAAKEFLKENVDVAAEFVKGLFKSSDKDISEIMPGEARVIQKGSQKAAVYRDKKGVLTVNSALCTHLGCVVHWNNAEESWDCPCHGSRFNPQGDVIEGPALNPLKKLNK